MKKLALAALLFASCATVTPTDQVRTISAHELQCPASQLQTTSIDERTIRVSGCGKEVTYAEACPPGPRPTRCTWAPKRTQEAKAQ